MAEFSGRSPYDDSPDEEEEAVPSSSWSTLEHRRLASSSGGGPVATGNVSRPSHFMPEHTPRFTLESSEEDVEVALCSFANSGEVTRRALPSGDSRSGSSMLCPSEQTPWAYPVVPGKAGQSENSAASLFPGPDYHFRDNPSPPGFFSPFGHCAPEGGSEASYPEGEFQRSPDTPNLITFPSTFRLERTNFVVTPPRSIGPEEPFLELVLASLRSSLTEAGVDILYFKPAHCLLECSYHVGNRFLSIFIRVYKAPDRSSGQLLDDHHMNSFENPKQDNMLFLVEAQLREGDRLHFSALFREIMRAFKDQEGVNLAGTFRYKTRTNPAVGEGLVLEEASMAPSRNSIRHLAERSEATGGAGLGASPPPVPLGLARAPGASSELDPDMIEDVVLLAKMLGGKYLDVQADAASAVAGLTANPEFLDQLSCDEAEEAAEALASASARLLVETYHRPARRHAAVVVANLSGTPALCKALLASDPAPRGVASMGYRASSSSSSEAQQRLLVESLVVLSMGIDCSGGVSASAIKEEEEIGMRRECMRALVGLAQSKTTREKAAMKLLLSTEPSGRGATDGILLKRLRECRNILKNSA